MSKTADASANKIIRPPSFLPLQSSVDILEHVTIILRMTRQGIADQVLYSPLPSGLHGNIPEEFPLYLVYDYGVLPTLRWSAFIAFHRVREHNTGRIVDTYGRAVRYARVEGPGMHHAFPIGENVFAVHTIADADGRFTLTSLDWPQDIRATSPDAKKHGQVDLAASKLPRVIVVR